jgi:hypothetical protein
MSFHDLHTTIEWRKCSKCLYPAECFLHWHYCGFSDRENDNDDYWVIPFQCCFAEENLLQVLSVWLSEEYYDQHAVSVIFRKLKLRITNIVDVKWNALVETAWDSGFCSFIFWLIATWKWGQTTEQFFLFAYQLRAHLQNAPDHRIAICKFAERRLTAFPRVHKLWKAAKTFFMVKNYPELRYTLWKKLIVFLSKYEPQDEFICFETFRLCTISDTWKIAPVLFAILESFRIYLSFDTLIVLQKECTRYTDLSVSCWTSYLKSYCRYNLPIEQMNQKQFDNLLAFPKTELSAWIPVIARISQQNASVQVPLSTLCSWLHSDDLSVRLTFDELIHQNVIWTVNTNHISASLLLDNCILTFFSSHRFEYLDRLKALETINTFLPTELNMMITEYELYCTEDLIQTSNNLDISKSRNLLFRWNLFQCAIATDPPQMSIAFRQQVPL